MRISETILWSNLFKLAQMLRNLKIYKLDKYNINREEHFHPYLERLKLREPRRIRPTTK